jgi:LysM repeat protein
MNSPNPLVPQGSLERQSQGKSTVRIAIFTIVSIHAVFFAGLLMQGCRRDDNNAALKASETATNQNTLPPLDPGYYGSTQEVAQAPAGAAAGNPAPPPSTDLPASTLPPVTALEPAIEGKAYTVVKGDTLAKIAKANGITVGTLSKANPTLDPAKLRPGQKIQIPPAAPAAPGKAAAGLGYKEPAGAESATAASVYTVKPGETLTRIAKAHGTTVKAIRTANSLKSDHLIVGQKLKLPAGHAKREATKTAAVSRATATNPAHAGPTPSGAGVAQ